MISKDYYFYINWRDTERNTFRVGILARIGDTYYMKTVAEESDKGRNAFSHGYRRIPGFINGAIYKSTNRVFDFFANRRAPSGAPDFDYMEMLAKTQGISATDSFSLEEIKSETQKEEIKKLFQEFDNLNKAEDLEKCEM